MCAAVHRSDAPRLAARHIDILGTTIVVSVGDGGARSGYKDRAEHTAAAAIACAGRARAHAGVPLHEGGVHGAQLPRVAVQGIVRSCMDVLRSIVGEVGDGAWGPEQELCARLPARLGGLQLGDLIGDGEAGPFQAQVIASRREANKRWEGLRVLQFEVEEVTEAVESGAHILGTKMSHPC
jgi:hypothetical protein